MNALKKLLPEKKFKVRVNYWGRGKYTVEWCNYRFIPIWHELCFWFEQTLTGNTECWTVSLFSWDNAEKVASKLKSINDVRKYYKADEDKEKAFKIAKEKYYEENVPYSKKYFKK